MSRIVTIVGSLSERSKTKKLAIDIQSRIAENTGSENILIDIADIIKSLAIRSLNEVDCVLYDALKAIETADLLIVASPVYKGSYTGMFKHLIDLVDYKALAGVPVALIAVGGSDKHALVVEHQMRPLFASFNAATLPTGVFVCDRSLGEGQRIDDPTALRIETLIREATVALRERARPPDVLAPA